MKKIGEYTVRGQATEAGGYVKINLFDGRFDTGYRVTRFHIWGATYSNSSNPDVVGKLATQPDLNASSVNFFNASDTREIAWSGALGGLDVHQANDPGVLVRDNMIVEDLYVYVRSVGDQPVNYLIEMDKYDISLNQGAYSMVRNSSQDINSQDR